MTATTDRTVSVDASAVVLDTVEDHVFGDTSREVGGVLVGTFEGSGPARVRAAVPALEAVGHQANVTFTHDVWESVLQTVERDHPDMRIVGWYHSHPGFGIFLSEYDTFIHENFFADHRMVALVIDPLAGTRGWFGWVDGSVSELGEAATTRAAVAPERSVGRTSAAAASPAARLGGRTKASLALAGLAMVMAGFVAGQVTAPDAGGNDGATDATASASAASGVPVPDGSATAPGSGPAVVTYTVQPGDTLWRISEALLGDGRRHVEIVAANSGVDPYALVVGQQIEVPIGPATS